MEQMTLFSPEDTQPNRPVDGCLYYRVCGNKTPSGNGLCPECLSAVRDRGDGRGDYDREDYLRSYYHD